MESSSKYEQICELSKKISCWGDTHPRSSPKDVAELREMRKQLELLKKMNRVRSFSAIKTSSQNNMEKWIYAAIIGTVMFSYIKLFNYNAKRHLTQGPLEWSDMVAVGFEPTRT